MSVVFGEKSNCSFEFRTIKIHEKKRANKKFTIFNTKIDV